MPPVHLIEEDSMNLRDNSSVDIFSAATTPFNFFDVMKSAQDHFTEGQVLETASSGMDESVMQAYREVVPKAQFEALKEENARIRRETPKVKEKLESTKQ